MLAPIRPSPIIPSCIFVLLFVYAKVLFNPHWLAWPRAATEPPEPERSLAEWSSASGCIEVELLDIQRLVSTLSGQFLRPAKHWDSRLPCLHPSRCASHRCDPKPESAGLCQNSSTTNR